MTTVGGTRLRRVSGIEHNTAAEDTQVAPAIDTMRRRRGGSDRLLASRGPSRWVDLDAHAVIG